jgi:3-oxoadipate enol-lactonase
MLVETNGIKLNVEVAGKEGAPWLVFSHALANNLTLWDDVVAHFSDRFHIMRYDHRGHGKSPAVKGPYSFPMLIDDVIGLFDALGIERAHWVGLSIGGMIGYGLAIHHPHRVISLTACDSRPDAPPDYAAYFQHRIDLAREQGMEGVVEPTITRWFTPETVAKNPPVLDKVRMMIRTTDPIGHEGCCEALKTLSYGPQLHTITTPTLILGGAKDKGAPPQALEEAAHKIKGAVHAIIPDAGHITALENPQAFQNVLDQFLSQN